MTDFLACRLGNGAEEEEEYSTPRKLSLKQWLEGDAESAATDERLESGAYHLTHVVNCLICWVIVTDYALGLG